MRDFLTRRRFCFEEDEYGNGHEFSLLELGAVGATVGIMACAFVFVVVPVMVAQELLTKTTK